MDTEYAAGSTGSRQGAARKGHISAWALAICLAAVSLCLAGCLQGTSKKDREERKAIIDDYREIILLQDRDSARYDQALAAMDPYIESPTLQKKAEAADTLWEILEELKAESAAFESYTISGELEQMLENQGISMVEYQFNADARYAQLEAYIQNLSFLDWYLEYADVDSQAMSDFISAAERYKNYQKEMRAYNYIGINYWFAQWGEEEEEYIKNQVLNRLESFAAEDAKWEDSREAVEEKMNACLDRVEEQLEQMTEFLRDSREQLYEMMETADKK